MSLLSDITWHTATITLIVYVRAYDGEENITRVSIFLVRLLTTEVAASVDSDRSNKSWISLYELSCSGDQDITKYLLCPICLIHGLHFSLPFNSSKDSITDAPYRMLFPSYWVSCDFLFKVPKVYKNRGSKGFSSLGTAWWITPYLSAIFFLIFHP